MITIIIITGILKSMPFLLVKNGKMLARVYYLVIIIMLHPIRQDPQLK